MKKKLIWTFSGLWLAAPLLLAQTRAPEQAPGPDPQASETVEAPTISSLDSELFYQLLVGEITAQEGDPGAGYALILDAARKTNDAQLYQRATEIALQSRSGDAALQAAQAWKQAQPTSRDPNRYVLQILIALNRIGDTVEPLKTGIELASPADRGLAISAIPRAYARASDKKLASAVVEQALASYLTNPATAAAAWTTVGRMRLAAGDPPGALEAAKKAQAADIRYEGPALLALELMEPKLPETEVLIKNYLTDNPRALPEIRMGYARGLLDAQRYAEASAQLQAVIRDKPGFAPAWLVLGSLQLQDNQLAQAQSSLERYVELAGQQQQRPAGEEANRGLTQAYLQLAQIAEKRKDFAAAEAWLGKISNSESMMLAQTRRASILASQGKLAEGRQLIRSLPERQPGDARLKLMAEVSLLRDLKQYRMAYELLGEATAKFPDDADLTYDQAMMAEKIVQLPAMERLLRRVIQIKPDYYSAYNALGYSFADRNVHLPEARQLILKALEYAPGDPFIRDSLGWVEFRMGNHAEAARIFADAYKTRPDAEIAAHYGEVLWSMGQRDKALLIWREGQLLNPENETLLETFKRLRVKP
ncbi:tetratricopeptide repeat protein [Polaromonas sp.]|uniref:tetratricopeptide repeat protein n=1 Tax=Polaromonas sp. TaxID=1869339 RepID=UPI003BACA5C8